MAMNDFIDFMREDLQGKSSPMVSFLSKRARLMIGFSIELLGQYLKILKQPDSQSNVDVQKFLDDISDNLEYFKNEEVAIREYHFNYNKAAEKIDSQLINKDMFTPADLSQIHAVDNI